MKRTFVIFKKEMLDTMRDRRSIIIMVILPILVFPLLMNIITKISISQARKAGAKILQVGLITNGNAPGFADLLKKREDMVLDQELKYDQINDMVQQKSLDFIIAFEKDFDLKVAENKTGIVEVHFKSSSDSQIAKRRITSMLNEYRDTLLDSRLEKINVDISFVRPLRIQEIDIASVKEKIGQQIGGFLPYIFIIFCFVGAMYPAIDLAAGEKERSTIETLLTSPATRLEIVLGKFMVITMAGIVSAALSLFGLFIAVKLSKEIPDEILAGILKIIELKSILLTLSLLVPLCVFFAAILLTISIFANSFKEAQAIMTPLNFIVIIPAVIGMIPGIKLNTLTAVIPVINVSLATKEIVSGTISMELLFLTYLSLISIAGLSLYFCIQWFKRESVIFRGI